MLHFIDHIGLGNSGKVVGSIRIDGCYLILYMLVDELYFLQKRSLLKGLLRLCIYPSFLLCLIGVFYLAFKSFTLCYVLFKVIQYYNFVQSKYTAKFVNRFPRQEERLYKKLDMCLWNTDAPGGNIVKIWQKSLSPTFWPHPTPSGMWCQWSVRNP